VIYGVGLVREEVESIEKALGRAFSAFTGGDMGLGCGIVAAAFIWDMD